MHDSSSAQLKVLVLTTDLPFFPGKHGVDFFHLRYLSRRKHEIGVAGPLHPFFPKEGVENLESILTSAHFWPRPAAPVTLPPQVTYEGRLAGWLRNLKPAWREKLLLRLLQLQDAPSDAYLKVATLANCAQQLLDGLTQRAWQVAVLIQSNTEPWLHYLPGHLATLVYFHDVRSQMESGRHTPVEETAVLQQERRVCQLSDVVGFVSELDAARARRLLEPRAHLGVAPIPVDENYYTPAPAGWRKDSPRVVLFTGHLSHPPNVDAVVYFLEKVWPLVRRRCDDAVFRVVGCLPRRDLAEACAAAAGDGVELHGDVPDIRPFFWNACVYVVPMRFGGGVRQKIIEAWLMEVPVVCTTMAAEGIAARDGVNCWLEDTPEAMAGRVAELLHTKARREVLSQASATARSQHSISATAGRFEELVRRAVHIKRSRGYRLLYDLRWMQIGRAGGIEQLAHEQLQAISHIDQQNAYRVLCPRSTYTEWNFPRGFRCRGFFTDKVPARVAGLRAAVTDRLAQGLGRPPVVNGAMRALRYYKELDCDLVHSISSFVHPDLRVFPHVLTMCDLQHVHFPEFFPERDVKVREELYRDGAERARHIICISEHTRRDLHEQYGVPWEKMTAIWVIPSQLAWRKLAEERAARLLGGLGLSRGAFLFYPAHSWPHKNHARLIEAFGMIAKDLPRETRLVLTGRRFEKDHPALEAIRQNRLEERVLHLGFRSPLEIRALYGGALALVFPSLFEGFGMPVAEAMITGCPVVCSNTTSLPEIAGEAAVTFDPACPEQMARAMGRVVGDAELRRDLVAAGERRRPLFSARWQAVKTLAVYRRVFEEYYGS